MSSAVVLAAAAVVLALLGAGVHQVPEGYMGVYWFGGALSSVTTDPGWRWMFPGVYTRDFVQLALQTDNVRNVPCGTSTGVIIVFDRIEVVNQLDRAKAHSTIKRFGTNYDKTFIFDKISHEINQFCSQATLHEVYISRFATLDESLAAAIQKTCDEFDTGIRVISIRVTKPQIPDAVRRNYEAVEAANSELQVAAREQDVTKKREETERLKQTIAATRDADIAVIMAEREANVTIINTRKKIAEKKGSQEIADIENQMLLAKQRAQTDALHYAIIKEAEALHAKLTEPFLRYTLFTAFANNTKIYFGERIPTIFSDMLGSAQALTQMAQDARKKSE